jgi:hypothetical protein
MTISKPRWSVLLLRSRRPRRVSRLRRPLGLYAPADAAAPSAGKRQTGAQRRVRQKQRPAGPALRQPRRAQCISAALESHDRSPSHPRDHTTPGLDTFRGGRAAGAPATLSMIRPQTAELTLPRVAWRRDRLSSHLGSGETGRCTRLRGLMRQEHISTTLGSVVCHTAALESQRRIEAPALTGLDTTTDDNAPSCSRSPEIQRRGARCYQTMNTSV